MYVLSILNREISKKAAPKRILRFINNRMNLEEPEIRASAVGTISKFGYAYPEMRDSIIDLLKW